MNENQKQNIIVLSMASFALVALALTPIILSLENASAAVVIHKNVVIHKTGPFHHHPFHKHCHVVFKHHHRIVICHRR
ncbi:MAG TPA: hypothetical protein VIY08_06505 [Candidatus Nitrosocosmicus sp.]